MKITYGPYTRKDGRQHVVIYDTETTFTTSMSYPKYLMEKKLQRKLVSTEEVDHIDNDKTNNNESNLQVLDTEIHQLKTIKERKRKTLYVEINCAVCEKKFYRERKYVNSNKRLGRLNVCSSSCHGTLAGVASGAARR